VRVRREGVTSEVLASLKEAVSVSGFAEDFTVAIADISRPGGESQFLWERGDRMFEVEISQLDWEETPSYGIVFKDVTRQVQSEQTRETARRYLEDILNNVNLGVVVLNDEMRVTNVNRAQESFWGRLGVNVSWVEAIGKPVSELVAKDSDQPWYQITKTVLQSGKTYEGSGRRYERPTGI
jgi:PAS domain-containing protein